MYLFFRNIVENSFKGRQITKSAKLLPLDTDYNVKKAKDMETDIYNQSSVRINKN